MEDDGGPYVGGKEWMANDTHKRLSSSSSSPPSSLTGFFTAYVTTPTTGLGTQIIILNVNNPLNSKTLILTTITHGYPTGSGVIKIEDDMHLISICITLQKRSQ